jgi:hypothetical protein
VSRYAPTPDEIKNYKLPSGKVGDQPIGELVPEDTFWYVDGYQANRDDPAPESHIAELPATRPPERRRAEEFGPSNPGRAFSMMRRVTASHYVPQPVQPARASAPDLDIQEPDDTDRDLENLPPSQDAPSQHSVSRYRRWIFRSQILHYMRT